MCVILGVGLSAPPWLTLSLQKHSEDWAEEAAFTLLAGQAREQRIWNRHVLQRVRWKNEAGSVFFIF